MQTLLYLKAHWHIIIGMLIVLGLAAAAYIDWQFVQLGLYGPRDTVGNGITVGLGGTVFYALRVQSHDAAFDRDFGPLRKALRKVDIPQNAGAEQLGALAQANPDSFVVHMRLADARRKAGDTAGAIRALEQAAQLLPALQGKQNPHIAIAEIAIEQKNVPRAIQALDAFLKVDGNDVDAARQRAQLLEPMGDAARTAVAYLRVVDTDPFDSHAQTIVGRAALQRKDAPAAVRAFRAALGAKPADVAVAHYDLAQAYLLGGQSAEAKRETLAALEVAPSFEPAQDLLLKIVGGG